MCVCTRCFFPLHEVWGSPNTGRGGGAPKTPLDPPLYCGYIYPRLYSTATQNTWCRGLALGTAPNARIVCWRYHHVGIFWRYLKLKFASPPTQNLKLALPPTPTPDTSQWNIGGVGSSGIGHVYFMYSSCIVHVYFMLFVHHFPRWLREN